MKLKISTSDVFDAAQDELAMIAKRVRSQNGEPNYSSIQLSSRERPVVFRLTQEAVQNFFAAAPERLTDYHKQETDILFSVNGGYDAADLTEFFNDACQRYVVAYVIAQYLAMAMPELAKKYISQADSLLLSLRNSILNKSQFLASADSLADTKGSVS